MGWIPSIPVAGETRKHIRHNVYTQINKANGATTEASNTSSKGHAGSEELEETNQAKTGGDSESGALANSLRCS
jgi:hypothetical protein